MNCPRCGAVSYVLRLEEGAYRTTRRYYLCDMDHRFSTVEAFEPPERSIEFRALSLALSAITARLKGAPR